jgi:hypothetical protein
MPDPHVGGDRPAARPTRLPKPSGGNRGRPLNAIKGYGPVQQFARKLRDLLAASGRPRRVDLASGRSNPTTMSKVDSGRALPAWDNVADYLRGCGQPATAMAAWKAEYEQFAHRAARFRPDLSGVTDRAGVHAAARELLTAEEVDQAELRRRRDDAERNGVAVGLPMPEPVPTAADLGTDPPGDLVLLWVVYLGGGTALDVEHWQRALARFPPETGPDPLPGDGPIAQTDSAPVADLPPVVTSDPARAAATTAATVAPPDARRWGRRVLVGVALLAVALLIGAYAVAEDRNPPGAGRTGPPASPSVPGVTSPVTPAAPTGATGAEAAKVLNDLADQVAQAPATPSTGTYAHVHRSLRSVDTTDTAGKATTGKATTGRVTEEWLTWSATGPGQRITKVTVEGVTTAPSPEPLPPGPPRGAAGPPTTDLVLLEQVLGSRRPARIGPPRMLLGVADLCETYPLSTAERVAVLRLLAGVAGITVRGQAADRAGRPGLAVSADHADGRRETLVLDRLDGRLLAHETSVSLTSGGGEVTEDVVFLDAGYDDLPG